jgi:N-acetyl sugar amidotransferase
MDTSDPEITFDAAGVCSHCRDFDSKIAPVWQRGESGAGKLAQALSRIKAAGRGRRYDSIIGLSGGVDSSFLAVKAVEWGLRPLFMHVDAGWNSETAVSNIEKVVRYTGFDLHTHVVDWEEMRDLQLAFLRSGIPNQDVPQDHVFFASLYHFANKNRIRSVLTGGNYATESIFPNSWQGSAMDRISLRAIHKRFGEGRLRSYRTVSFIDYFFAQPFLHRMRIYMPLNWIPYRKDMAIAELEQKTGWRPYGRKHGESVFTKFFQNYYLPQRFGYDKRRPHLSSMVVSGQMTRGEALEQLKLPLYEEAELQRDKVYVASKLRVSVEELDAFISLPLATHRDFPNWDRRRRFLSAVRECLSNGLGLRVTRPVS